MLGDPKECRLRARQCLLLANRAASPKEQRTFERIHDPGTDWRSRLSRLNLSHIESYRTRCQLGTNRTASILHRAISKTRRPKRAYFVRCLARRRAFVRRSASAKFVCLFSSRELSMTTPGGVRAAISLARARRSSRVISGSRPQAANPAIATASNASSREPLLRGAPTKIPPYGQGRRGQGRRSGPVASSGSFVGQQPG